MKSKFGQRSDGSVKASPIYSNVIVRLDHDRLEFIPSSSSGLNPFLGFSEYLSRVSELINNLYRKSFMIPKLEKHPP